MLSLYFGKLLKRGVLWWWCSGYRKVAALAAKCKPAAARESSAEGQTDVTSAVRKGVFQEALRSMAASEGAPANDVEVRSSFFWPPSSQER